MMSQQSLRPTGRDILILDHWHDLPPPLFILAPPRSFTSIACAMLGQHPQLYGLPETHLFCEETVSARAARVARATYPMGHGLLRAVAQLYFGAQNEATVRLAQQWLRRRSDVTTDFIFKVLADRAFPRILVDKSPSTVNSLEVLQRTHSKFPGARFVHLLRHPRGHGESVVRYIDERRKHGPIPPTHWLLKISQASEQAHDGPEGPVLDPQIGWYARHTTICDFLSTIPSEAQMRVRGEDLLAEPDRMLREIASWMGLRADAPAIGAMKHPERSPYAFLGPRGARYGNDAFFLQDPSFRPGRARAHNLEGPLSWRSDGQGFTDEVKGLAREFGYG
jgi:hypothetical protein